MELNHEDIVVYVAMTGVLTCSLGRPTFGGGHVAINV